MNRRALFTGLMIPMDPDSAVKELAEVQRWAKDEIARVTGVDKAHLGKLPEGYEGRLRRLSRNW